MLLCGPFAIEGIEGQHFESGWILDRVPLHWIGSSSSRLLPNGGGLEGSDLLLKSLHPVTGVTIGNVTLQLYFVLGVSLRLRLDFIIRFMRRMEANGAVRVGALLVLAVSCRAGMLGLLLADALKHLLNHCFEYVDRLSLASQLLLLVTLCLSLLSYLLRHLF